MANIATTAGTAATVTRQGNVATGGKPKPPTTGQIWPRGNKTQ